MLIAHGYDRSDIIDGDLKVLKFVLVPVIVSIFSMPAVAESFVKSDISGVKFGMKLGEVKSILEKKVNDAFVYEVGTRLSSTYFSRDLKLGLIADITDPRTVKQDPNVKDLDQMWVSVDPNEPDGEVYGLSRYISYSQNNRSTFDTYVKSLIDKYGPVTSKVEQNEIGTTSRYYWIAGDIKNLNPNALGKCMQRAELHVEKASFNNVRVNTPFNGRGIAFSAYINNWVTPETTLINNSCKAVLRVELDRTHFFGEDLGLVQTATFTFVDMERAERFTTSFKNSFAMSARAAQQKKDVENSSKKPAL